MKLSFVLLISCTAFLCCQADYMIGDQGESCNQACFREGKNCNPVVETDDSFALFTEHGIICEPDGADWNDESQPCFVSDKKSPKYGKCLGFTNVPSALQCCESNPSVRRLCNCDAPNSISAFGLGYSGGEITTNEKWIFAHNLVSGDVGVLDHFWITYGSAVDNGTIIRYYIDGEKNASIEFTPSMACGVGFYDTQGPWGTQWFGKGADDAGWFNNFKIPFQKNIVVTAQHLYGNYTGFYMIVRGSINVPIVIGGQTLPKTAKMNLNVIDDNFAPMAWIPLVNVTSGAGVHFMITAAAASGNWQFLEGCIHAYFNGENAFPGVVLATGTEDYFDSAWYFNAGEFHLPVSGYTHSTENDTMVTWSAYRFHDEDPLFFDDGFQLIWRNGDRNDPFGLKCYEIEGGNPVGSPTTSQILTYAWYYTW